jgi:hypothetical protein
VCIQSQLAVSEIVILGTVSSSITIKLQVLGVTEGGCQNPEIISANKNKVPKWFPKMGKRSRDFGGGVKRKSHMCNFIDDETVPYNTHATQILLNYTNNVCKQKERLSFPSPATTGSKERPHLLLLLFLCCRSFALFAFLSRWAVSCLSR